MSSPLRIITILYSGKKKTTVRMSLLDVPAKDRNTVDNFFLHGMRLANDNVQEEISRICKTNDAANLGIVWVIDDRVNRQKSTSLLGMCSRYDAQNYVVLRIRRQQKGVNHSNLLIGCPANGLYFVFEPHGHGSGWRSLASFDDETLRSFAFELHGQLLLTFALKPAFAFINIEQSCPRLGPQLAAKAQALRLDIADSNQGQGLCLLYSLLFLDQLFNVRPLLTAMTLKKFVGVQQRLSKQPTGLQSALMYCHRLIQMYGVRSNNSIRKSYGSNALPKQIPQNIKNRLTGGRFDPRQFAVSKLQKAYRSYGACGIPRIFAVQAGDKLIDMREFVRDWLAVDPSTSSYVPSRAWGLRSASYGGVTLPDMQRITWTLACASLDMLPVPRVLYTMMSDDANEAFLLTGSFTRKTLQMLYSAAVFGIDEETKKVEYANAADAVEKEWRKAQNQELQELHAYDMKRASLQRDFESSTTDVVLGGGMFLGFGTAVIAGAACFASGGLLLPFAAAVGGNVLGYGGAITSEVIDRSRKNQLNAIPRPYTRERYHVRDQVMRNKDALDRLTQDKIFVVAKTGVHAFLAVLRAQLRAAKQQLKDRQGSSYYRNEPLVQTMSLDDYQKVIKKAEAADRADPRLKRMFSYIDKSWTPAVEVCGSRQLGNYATGLCKLILFKLMP